MLAALLSFQPHMLAKSIASLSALKSWDPVPSAEYLGVVRYLAQLLQSAAVDHKVRAQLRAAFAPAGAAGSAAAVTAASVATSMAIEDAAEEGVGEQRSGDAQQTTQAQQNILSGLLGSWFPPGSFTQLKLIFLCTNAF